MSAEVPENDILSETEEAWRARYTDDPFKVAESMTDEEFYEQLKKTPVFTVKPENLHSLTKGLPWEVM